MSLADKKDNNYSTSSTSRDGDLTSERTQNEYLPDKRDDGLTTGYITLNIPRWVCCSSVAIATLVASTAVLVAIVYNTGRVDTSKWLLEVQERVGKEGVSVFKAYDLNRDGYLSILEFEPLIHHLKNITQLTVLPVEEFLEHTIVPGEELLLVYAYFEPLKLETMKKDDILTMDFQGFLKKCLRLYLRFIRYTILSIFSGDSPLTYLKTWNKPNRDQCTFGTSEFKSFLPEDVKNIALGKPYHLVPVEIARQFFDSGQLLNNRFYPPAPKNKELVLYRLLGMMHPRPFVHMRFFPRGTVACVRAYNAEYLHIIFRIHAEFQLNEPPINPFWFTPAQFAGDLVISRDGSHVAYFRMRVPNERRLNVDMEWIVGRTDGEAMEVDIGYMPLMEWNITLQSLLPVVVNDTQGKDDQQEQASSKMYPAIVVKPEDMEWDSEISLDDALKLIETEFFPFKKVTYYNLTEAYQLSQEQEKPMHAVVLWGALDDQSC